MTTDLRKRVDAEINRCAQLIKQKYGVDVRLDHILYTVRGTKGGVANYVKHTINLNAGFLQHDPDTFIARTVPHEFAHLACAAIYPETLHVARGEKREVHGPRWVEIMHVLGADPSRCHSYDVSVVAPRNAYEVVCAACGCQYVMRQRKTPSLSRYRCKCGKSGTLQFKQSAVETLVAAGEEQKAVARVSASMSGVATEHTTSSSKMDVCKKLYAMHKQFGRAKVIELFMSVCGIGKAHASTYYQTCKKQLG